MSDNGIDLNEVDKIVARIGRGRERTIAILQAIQNYYNWLPPEALRRVCEITDITPASISTVSTFYSQFRHKPAGKYWIKVCIGTACHVKGAEAVFDAFKRYLNLASGEDTDKDKIFTLSKVACLGCCMLAPAVMIDDVTYGFVETGKVSSVLRDFLESQKAKDVSIEYSSAEDISGEVRICLCASCVAGGANKIYHELLKQIARIKLPVKVIEVGCTGMSFQTPLIEIVVNGQLFKYGRVCPEDIPAILLRHFKPVKLIDKIRAGIYSLLEKLYTDEAWEPVTRYSVDVRQGPESLYFGKQKHICTEHCGEISPLDIDSYKAKGGFVALEKVLKTMTPLQVIEEITKSGLRGRGGAGFPTGIKWSMVRKNDSDPFIICNGDEGDPGAFMDRMILESFPYRVIEGMIIAAYAVGARKGILYIRAEYPLAIKRVRQAIETCTRQGLLGNNIMGSSFNLELELVEGAGAFVCGEETALMAAVEGRRGMPRFRPPYPAEKGLWGKPTLINNVETYACVPWIIRNGAHSFYSLGTEKSKGTKTFALAGKIIMGGLVEVPMGITIKEIVEVIGGGVQPGKVFKAVQIGGPSGGCIPASMHDIKIDYEELTGAGAMMGSGGLVVFDDSDCMVDIARYFVVFTQYESCGKCTFCRIGSRMMLEILNRLCSGAPEEDDVKKLEEIAYYMKEGSLCGLGKTAPNPVLTTIKYFREEYEAHLRKRCPSKKCKALIKYVVTDKCIGCTKCAQQCPVKAIELRPYEKHDIDIQKCTRCDSCRQVCPEKAIEIQDLYYEDCG